MLTAFWVTLPVAKHGMNKFMVYIWFVNHDRFYRIASLPPPILKPLVSSGAIAHISKETNT